MPPLQKQNLNIPFVSGIQTKSDPFQIPIGSFALRQNSLFTTTNSLIKRNGFPLLTTSSDASAGTLTTFKGNLISIGSTVAEYFASVNAWYVKNAIFETANLSVQSILRSGTSQLTVDMAYAPNGNACVVYTDTPNFNPNYTYAIFNTSNGDSVFTSNFTFGNSNSTSSPINPSVINPPAPKVFYFANTFVIIGSDSGGHLFYFTADPTTNTQSGLVNLATDNDIAANWDAVLDSVDNRIYFAYKKSGAAQVKTLYLDSGLTAHALTTQSTTGDQLISIAIDVTVSPHQLYISGNDTSVHVLTYSIDSAGTLKFAPVTTTFTAGENNVGSGITSLATGGSCHVYSYFTNTGTYTISSVGTVTGFVDILLPWMSPASKPFQIPGKSQVFSLMYYTSKYQPSYFLMDLTNLIVVSKLAYENAIQNISGGNPIGIPNPPSVAITASVNVYGQTIYTIAIPYLLADLIQPITTTNTSFTTGIYTFFGINRALFTLPVYNLSTAEASNNLLLSGGKIEAYDGTQADELGFYLFPEIVSVTSLTTTPGTSTIANGTYSYVATYEWTDAQGNLFRSAPSLPATIVFTQNGSNSAFIQITIRMLPISEKTTPIRVVLYRYSTKQPIYYEENFAVSFNTPSSVTVVVSDISADSVFTGNAILYTTGGILENIWPPAVDFVTTYKNNVFALDSEDKNLFWFSKPIIEATPLEFSDTLTYFVEPNLNNQRDTGGITAAVQMDDKFIMFRSNSIFYMVGDGPDITGANNQFSEPQFITSTVGTTNFNSVVVVPVGVMFQSDKGFWLLGRDLSTSYIGASVEQFNSLAVVNAILVPKTTQVRFMMSDGSTALLYDYFCNQWDTLVGLATTSNTLYAGAHTYLGAAGAVFQDTPNNYTDGTSTPVLMKFQTGWINVAGLQGFERAYKMYLLGSYISPHKLQIDIAYNYHSTPTQTTIITPNASDSLEQWRIFFTKQKCESFQVTVTELSTGTNGAGLTISGINLEVGIKKGAPRLSAAQSTS